MKLREICLESDPLRPGTRCPLNLLGIVCDGEALEACLINLADEEVPDWRNRCGLPIEESADV